jgi:flagellum-specific ATP synthase
MSLHAFQARLRAIDPVLRLGRVRRVVGSHIEADGPNAPLGTLCEVDSHERTYIAEIVAIDRDGVVLSPFEEARATFSGAQVRVCGRNDTMPAGDAYLGRAVDALGRPADGQGPIVTRDYVALKGVPPRPLERASPHKVLETGVRAIDGLLTLGKGQRVGVFAASGVGKTTLLTQLANQVNADVIVLCLAGERGRETEAIWSTGLKPETRRKATLVAATSDQSAVMRVRACHYALALCEYWRDRGKDVLLLLDSVSRLAMAMREIGLASGEPPTVRAYTPSVFAQIPKLVERCGGLKKGGSISAIMTVLSETDDIDDPISELMKSLLDGHIVLSRTMAGEGQFPPVDVCRSVSRQAKDLMRERHYISALQVIEWLNLFQSSRALLDTGLYAKGANPRTDRAVEKNAAILAFLKQDWRQPAPYAETIGALENLAGEARHAA